MPILEINHLTKKYGRITAVNDLNLTVSKGEVFGILGPNGSGKTTTLGIILGITHPDNGHFSWFDGAYGDNPRRHLGALLETPNFYPYLSALDNLKIVAHIKKAPKAPFDQLLELVSLGERKNTLFRTFSLGMKQRLAIAAALIGDPEVLIFDEPTNGLDPQGIAEVRQTITDIAAGGKTIIMASHILDEVEKVCSHVAIIKNGHLKATGTVGAILSDDKIIEIGADDLDRLFDLVSSLPQVKKTERPKAPFLLLHAHPELTTATLNRLAFDHGILLTHLIARQKSLESEFLEITK
ncbi:MAG: ABC transporter ATP-binding protein [Bacteroidetes bacterium]|nr:MAG: ABC transporter ATP-binding protein [Bacteroidota bacterium]